MTTERSTCTVAEAAAQLGVTTVSITRYIRQGLLQASVGLTPRDKKQRKCWLIEKEELLRFSSDAEGKRLIRRESPIKRKEVEELVAELMAALERQEAAASARERRLREALAATKVEAAA